jgi:hypothetical protein
MKTKKAQWLAFLLTLIIFLIAIYFFYQYYLDLTSEPIPFIKNSSENITSYSSQLQSYPNMLFIKKDIFYNVNNSCNKEKIVRMLQAFSRIENETSLLKFYENIYPEKSDILISCQETKEEHGKYFIAGEGGPTQLTNTSSFYIIEKAKILLLYSKNQCSNYNIELHELLHVLGFEHSDNPESIMYNSSSCNQQLTPDIIQELKRLYSIPRLADLHFSNISAIKHGSYLDFNTEIRNIGLAQAENVKLEIYADENRKIDEYDLGNTSYGEGKFLEVKNSHAGRQVAKIKFVIVSGQELSKENNIAELILPN